jgi:hydroxymethylbilane synthase
MRAENAVPDLTVVTRGSLLARTQTAWIVAQIEAAHPGLAVIIAERTTSGDRVQDRPLPEVGGKGLFTLELEEALRGGEADLAVHSLKDLPTALPDGLCLGAVPPREDARDALILPAGRSVEAVGEDPLRLLAPGARVGTSSTRRAAILRHRRPDLVIDTVRGNLDTRLRKLDEGQYDAILLAAAGLNRLGWGARISALLPVDLFVPAPAQGALGLECRAGDGRVLDLLAAVDHGPTRAAVSAERAFLAALGGGCLLPVGAHAVVDGEALALTVAVASPDGTELMTRTAVGPAVDATALGEKLAAVLLAEGAGRLLESLAQE